MEQMVERPAQQRDAGIEGGKDRPADSRIEQAADPAKPAGGLRPGDVVEIAGNDHRQCLLAHTKRDQRGFPVAASGAAVRHRRFGMDGIEPEAPASLRSDRRHHRGHVLGQQTLERDVDELQTACDDHAVAVVLRARHDMRIQAGKRRQGGGPAIVHFHQHQDVGFGAFQLGQHGLALPVRHLDVGGDETQSVAVVPGRVKAG
jgi:hypothetical protein